MGETMWSISLVCFVFDRTTAGKSLCGSMLDRWQQSAISGPTYIFVAFKQNNDNHFATMGFELPLRLF